MRENPEPGWLFEEMQLKEEPKTAKEEKPKISPGELLEKLRKPSTKPARKRRRYDKGVRVDDED